MTLVPGLHVKEIETTSDESGEWGSHSTIGDIGVGKIITPDVTVPVSHGEVSGNERELGTSWSKHVDLKMLIPAEPEPPH